jgi:hypothetical protein
MPKAKDYGSLSLEAGMRHNLAAGTVVFLAFSAGVSRSDAGAVVVGGPVHATDGQFGANEWNSVTPAFFPVVGNAGGSYLYAAQGQGSQFGNLYLMYDWVNSPNVGQDPTHVPTYFDVFFTVQANDYVAHFGTAPDGASPNGFDQTNLLVYEKSDAVVSPLNPDGSFNLSGPPWTLLDPPGGPNDADFTNGKFVSAVGFGASPNSTAAHLEGELQMTINTTPFNNQPSDGLYDPDPAFWSGSGIDPEGLDPPISSAIFTLNPDGTTTLDPVFALNGGPAQQPQDVVPEPSSIILFAMSGLFLLGHGRLRKAISGAV